MAERELGKEYWLARSQTLKRDCHKCQYPNCRKRTRLEVHHIIPYCYSASLRYEVSNLISLCKFHHHSIKGKESFYAEMFRTILAQQKQKPKKK